MRRVREHPTSARPRASAHGGSMRFLDREPVFAVSDHLNAAAQDLPGAVKALQHLRDLPVFRTMPSLASNRAVVARRN